MKQIPFTKEGHEKLKKELEDIRNSRPAAVEDLSKARSMGDLSENGYYKAARFKLTGIDRRIREINYILKYAVVTEAQGSDSVQIGSTVILNDGDNDITYSIVGGYESNPLEGKISQISPIGKAILGKKVGEKVSIEIPKGTVSYIIKSIS